MRKWFFVVGFLGVVFGGSWVAREFVRGEREVVVDGDVVVTKERLVALAPSTVEILFALGVGERVVGVSRYTTFPAEAVVKPKVGGYLDLDVEALVRLRPDGVVLLEEQGEVEERLRKMGLDTIRVDHMSVAGILESVFLLGDFVGEGERGRELEASLRERVEAVRARGATGERPVVLVSIGREAGLGKVVKLTAAGGKGFHTELIGIAGGVNGYEGSVAFPMLTREHLIRMNPDVIIDLLPAGDFERLGREKVLADWAGYSELKAVREGRVFVLGEDRHYVPGPRFVETLEDFSGLIQGGGEDE